MTTAGDIDIRRRRALYRAGHRGTKELDLLLGRYAEAKLHDMEDRDLAIFEILLALPDPDIETWFRERPADLPPSPELAGLVSDMRSFHGLSGSR